MRLRKVETGHRFPQKLKLMAMRLVGRREPPDVIKTLLYRPEFFGTEANRLFQAALRGPSDWTVGEREFMATYVSRLNQCLF
jgi:hypothetical protein